MGYKIYVKDNGTRGRFEVWDRKTYSSKKKAVDELGKISDLHRKKYRKFAGKAKWDIRSTGNTTKKQSYPRIPDFGFNYKYR